MARQLEFDLGPTMTDQFIAFARERHSIYVRRFKDKKPWPWTEDRILQTYRFCNIYRELDTVTQWVQRNIRVPFADHPNLWFMLCAARQINWPDTLQELIEDKKAWPHKKLSDWDPERLRTIMNDRKARGEQVYTGAYMLTNVLVKDDPRPKDKPWFTAYQVLESVRQLAPEVLAATRTGMEATHSVLCKGYGWGGFMAYEVVTDMRHTKIGSSWKDINTFAHAGPGALRGLNRIAGRPLNQPLSNERALTEMILLGAKMRAGWPKPTVWWPKLEMREVEHTLCEFDKYQRVLHGEGKPRSLYRPSINRSFF